MYYFYFLVGIILGSGLTGAVGGYILKKKYNVTKKLPYRWVCQKDECNMQYSSNLWESTIEFAEKHNREVHQE